VVVFSKHKNDILLSKRAKGAKNIVHPRERVSLQERLRL